MKLALETLHIILRHNSGMNVVLDGVVFRGKAKCIPSHGIEYIVALHPALARHYVQGRVGTRMSHMQPLP